MVSFNKFFTSVYLAVVYASVSNAAPSPISAKFSTHRVRTIGNVKVEAYHPETSYETFGEGVEHAAGLIGEIAGDSISFILSKLGLSEGSVTYKGGYSRGENKYAYVKQTHNGINFANAVANVAWNKNKVVSFGSSFIKPWKIAPSKPSFDLNAAISAAESSLGGKHNGHPASVEYVALPDGSASLAHVIQIQSDADDSWLEAFVDAHTGALLSVNDFVSHASYTVLPIKKEYLPDGQETLADPQDLIASPFGWHATSANNFTDTQGNNVIAYKSSQTSTTAQSSSNLVFNYPYDASLAPTGGKNIDAARTNAFYIINTVHDIAYRYGFTETAFNFQQDNFGKGGAGNDRVLMSVQDASGTNNANFATPPDGQPGQCRMYIWTTTTPNRDGSLENDIIVHEMTHGITNRMTGGGTGRCLQTTEAGGMGEGWSDAFAEWTEQKSATITDYVMGAYVYKPAGIRNYPYSTNPSVNPLRYSSIASLNEVHNIGEVWANMLHNVYAPLVEAYGFSTTAATNPDGPEGNIVFLHLFIDSLALQPCNPTFVSARDAWIQADKNRYNGANKCLLWKAFASRGLGVNAKNYVDDSSVPDECNVSTAPAPTTTSEASVPSETSTSTTDPSSTEEPSSTPQSSA